MPSREEQMVLKRQLDYSWSPFFARFGSFTDVQVRAIPPILDGRDVLVSARTASGKTEAVSAPLVERIRRDRWLGLSVLYVCPTRALVNDLFRRLETPFESAGVSLGMRTGDYPTINFSDPPQVLITTPESFDSMMTRCPKAFLRVRAVVVDEIHLLDNTARGDQVRLLLARLRSLRSAALRKGDAGNDEVQVALLSATVSRPEEVAERYAVNARVIHVEGARSIDASIAEAGHPVVAIQEIIRAASAESRKILVFCRKRNEADSYCALLRRTLRAADDVVRLFGESVCAHHGKLDRKFRLEVEKRFNESQAAICFATSTLELGIDIGDIDLVVFLGAPYSIGSFLQCIGRGNRRTHRTVALCLAKDPLDTLIFQALEAAARTGVLDERHYAFRPSVIVQQILSYLRQVPNGEVVVERVGDLLALAGGSDLALSDASLTTLVDHLVSVDVLKYSRGNRISLGEVGSDLCEGGGGAFSNFSSSSPNEETMFDEQGRPIGQVPGGQLQVGDSVAFGGRAKQVLKSSKGRLDVTAERVDGPWTELKAPATRRALPFDLAQLLVKRAGYCRHEFPTVERNGTWIVLHGLGSVYGNLLAHWLREEFNLRSRPDGLFIKLKREPPFVVLDPTRVGVESLVRRRAAQFARGIDAGKYASLLPHTMLADFVVEALNVPRFVEAVSGRSFVPAGLSGVLLS